MPVLGAIGALALALLLFSGAARSTDAEIAFVSTDTPPFWSASMPDNGWGGSILRLVSEAAGVRYVIDYLPVKRFRASTSPFIVGDPDILEHADHRAVFPIGVFNSAFFFHRPHHQAMRFRSLEEMRGHTLGVLRGTLEGKEAFVANGIRVEESDTVESLLRKLERGRIDFAIMVNGAGLHALGRLFPQRHQEFEQVPIPGTERPIAIIIDLEAPAGREAARRYARVLLSTLHSPQYQALVERYYGKMLLEGSAGELQHFLDFYSPTWEE